MPERARRATGGLPPTSMTAAQDRLTAVARVLDLPDLREASLEARIHAAVGDSSRPAATRAAAAIVALTGRYALDEEQEAVADCLTAGQVGSALRMLDAMVRGASPGTLHRMPIQCPSVVVDLSRSGTSGEITGIPRVASALAAGAAGRGFGVVRWQDGAPGLITDDRSVPESGAAATGRTSSISTLAQRAAQQNYSRVLARLNLSRPGSHAARLIRAAASPAVSAAKRRTAPGIVILGHCTYVTAEIPVPAVVRRLLPWADVAPGLHLRTVVYDLLPLVEPRYFAPESITRHAGFGALISRSDSVVVASQHVAEQAPHVARLWGRAEDLTVDLLPLATDAATWVPRPPPRGDRPAFVMVGGLEPRKNHAVVLRAVILMAASGLPTTVHMVGNRRPPHAVVAQLLREAEAAGVHVERHIGVSDAELAGIMDACVASIYLSHAEGYGLPPVESVARGLPVVIADVPPVNEHLSLGGVLAVPPDRPDVLAAVLTRLVSDPEYAASVRAAARANPPGPTVDDWVSAVLEGGGA